MKNRGAGTLRPRWSIAAGGLMLASLVQISSSQPDVSRESRGCANPGGSENDRVLAALPEPAGSLQS